MFPLAIISDIHGNRWALEAVLEDIEKRWISDIVNLGDVFYSPLDPNGTAEILMRYCIPTILGNEDRILLEYGSNPSPTLKLTKDLLSTEHLQWLSEFDKTLKIGEVFLCHGTPFSDSTYLLNNVTSTGLSKRSNEGLNEFVKDLESNIILCGHDHIQGMKKLSTGQIIVNPGSVGWQAFDDNKPFYHKIESGSPEARYAIIYESESGFEVEFVRIPYDFEAASEAATANGFDDWAYTLKTGRLKSGK